MSSKTKTEKGIRYVKFSFSESKAGFAFKDIGVWIGIKCVITSPRQAQTLCRNSGHKSRGGHTIKRVDVLPQSWSYLVIRP